MKRSDIAAEASPTTEALTNFLLVLLLGGAFAVLAWSNEKYKK